MKLTTTLSKIQSHNPCRNGYEQLIDYLGKGFNKNEEINLLTILESNGVQDCLWALKATIQDSKNISVQISIDFAKSVLPIFEKAYPNDKRPRLAIESAENWVKNPIKENRKAAAYASTDANAAYGDADIDADAAETAADAANAAAAAYAASAAYAAAKAAADAYTPAADAAAYVVNAIYADTAAAADYAADAAADMPSDPTCGQAEIIKQYLI